MNEHTLRKLNNPNPVRKMTADEERLIEELIEKTDIPVPSDWKQTILVQTMEDSGQGSLYLFPDGKVLRPDERRMNNSFGDICFEDADGMPANACINLDTDGKLYELDVLRPSPIDPILKIGGRLEYVLQASHLPKK